MQKAWGGEGKEGEIEEKKATNEDSGALPAPVKPWMLRHRGPIHTITAVYGAFHLAHAGVGVMQPLWHVHSL